jgi:hypothetical protein
MKVQIKLTSNEKKQIARFKKELKTQVKNMEQTYAKLDKAFLKSGKIPARLSKATKVATREAQSAIKKMDRFYTRVKKRLAK